MHVEVVTSFVSLDPMNDISLNECRTAGDIIFEVTVYHQNAYNLAYYVADSQYLPYDGRAVRHQQHPDQTQDLHFSLGYNSMLSFNAK